MSLKWSGIAETTLRLLRGRSKFAYDALRGGRQWHILCNDYLLCENAFGAGLRSRAAGWDVTTNYVAGQTELPTPMCYTCFLTFNSPTVVVL